MYFDIEQSKNWKSVVPVLKGWSGFGDCFAEILKKIHSIGREGYSQ